MNRTLQGKEIVAGYAFAAATLCFGFCVATAYAGPGASPALIDNASTLVLRVFMAIAAAIVLNFTFAWGRLRGFGVGRADGTINVTNLARNVVVAIIVFFGIFAMSAPVSVALTTAMQ